MHANDLKPVLQRCRREDFSLSALWALLEILEEDRPYCSVADAIGVSSASLTGLADRLVSQGYAERENSKADRRKVTLGITEAGRLVVARVLGS